MAEMIAKSIVLDRETLPTLFSGDVVVVGGSLGGVATALTMARAGRKVALVEPRTYVGREITATLRPWVRVHGEANLAARPELITACIEASGSLAMGSEFPLHPDAVKLCLEDLLLDTGVKLIYASLPVGLVADGGLGGVVIGNKSGRQVLACEALVDTSATGLVARLAGAQFEKVPDRSACFSRTLEFDGVGRLDRNALHVPRHLSVVGDKVLLHLGYRRQGHVLIECQMLLPGAATNALQVTAQEIEARRKMIDIAAYLVSRVPEFREARLAAVSHESHGPQTSRMAGPVPEWARPLDALTLDTGLGMGSNTRISISCLAGPVAGLWCLNEAARVDPPLREAIRDPVLSGHLGTRVARALIEHWERATARAEAPSGARPDIARSSQAIRSTLRALEPEQPQRGRRYAQHSVTPSVTPVLCNVDVLVVGGGTSGAMAAIAAAREGRRTLVVDMNPGLGGTGTYGGVNSYWFGRRVGFANRSMTWTDRVHEYLGHPKLEGASPRWNMEAKTQALMEEAEDAGVEILLNTLAIGAIVEGNSVHGIVAATRTGPVALLGKVVIDATGDGDVAAFAGAECTYGSARDHATMWYSLAQIAAPGRTRNNFTSMVDVSNIEDYTRAILAGRRRGEIGPDHDHGIYVAPRESRHIRADVALTLTDQLLRQCWPDVVSVAFSNNDIKGQHSSDWMRMGLIPPNLEIEIPYRALLPKGLDNILVVGKAVSATHDALPAIRMQPDLENLGGAAGLAAAMAIEAGKAPRAIDVRALQARLVQVGVLPERVLTRTLVPRKHTKAHLRSLVDSLSADRPLHAYSDMDMEEVFRARIPLVDLCCAGPEVIPILEEALEHADGPRRVLLAQILAVVGSPAGVPVLISAIQDQLATGRLPERTHAIRHAVEYAPDQAAMPKAANMLYSLGMAQDRRALPVWQRVVDLLAFVEDEDVCSQAKGVFYYVDAVCFGVERLGDPSAVPILRQLHSYAPFRHKELLSGFQADYLEERAAYLEVVVGRALARCGSPEGVVILIDYLNDVRGLLAEHAHDELVAITGQDLDAAAWAEWLEVEGEGLKPAPWLAPTDPMKAWGKTILTTNAGDRNTEATNMRVHESTCPGTSARSLCLPQPRD